MACVFISSFYCWYFGWMEINENVLNIVTVLILTLLIVGISFYWLTLYPNPLAQTIKRQIDFRDALLRSFQQSHPNLKDCRWQGQDIVCKSEWHYCNYDAKSWCIIVAYENWKIKDHNKSHDTLSVFIIVRKTVK